MTIDMNALALVGAKARLTELQTEVDALLKAFPQLRNGAAPAKVKVAAESTKQRKTAGWTAAQRRAVSERMKKYWASRRKATKS